MILRRFSHLVSPLFIIIALAACGSSGSGDTPPPASQSNTGAAQPTAPSGTKWLTVYYPSYQQFTMPPAEVNYTSLTYLIHWPVMPVADGSLDTKSNDFSPEHSQDVVTRSHTAGIKVLLGVGGDAASGATAGFKGATSPANRQAFVNNIVKLMKDRGYDGVDINWEEIKPADDANFLAFIRDLRQALDTVNPRPLLTIPPTTGDDGRPELIAQVATLFDQINLQTYVMAGPYEGWVTWFNSALNNGGFEFPASPGEQVPSIDREVARFQAAGIPLNRMALGAQLAGFIWAGGKGTSTGGATAPRQSWTTAPTQSMVDYSAVVNDLTAAKGYQKQFDAVAQVPYLSLDSKDDAQDRFVSYEDEQSIQAKAKYVNDKGLGGMFMFEMFGDYFPGKQGAEKHPLVSAAGAAL